MSRRGLLFAAHLFSPCIAYYHRRLPEPLSLARGLFVIFAGQLFFLLTPKLLPDHDYGEDTVIQIVYNGPYMETKSAFSLVDFC